MIYVKICEISSKEEEILTERSTENRAWLVHLSFAINKTFFQINPRKIAKQSLMNVASVVTLRRAPERFFFPASCVLQAARAVLVGKEFCSLLHGTQ